MNYTKKKWSRALAMILAVVMTVMAVPMSAFAAVASDLPENMADHSILRALAYTGYDVQKQKDDGTLYQTNSYGLRTPSSVLSNIHYGTALSGKETVADSSTVTGKKPDIAKFEQYGLCCAAFVTYYVCNYLPNIEGADTQFILDAINATGMNSQAVVTWQTALNNLANSGKVQKIGTNASNVDRSKLAPGDLIIFGNSENSHVHIAVYSGTYKGVDYIIHVGNDRGPEISRVDWMAQSDEKPSTPNAYFHLPEDIFEQDGSIEVYKKDTDGKNLAGAVFTATNTETKKKYVIGPTNSSGYAKSEDRIPYGTYTIVETVFPTDYRGYGATSWTKTLDKNTPNATITINAVNEIIPGSAKIVKTSEDGKVDGISFRVQGNGVDKTVQTKNGGQIQIDNLKPGVYTVTEQTENKYVPQESRSVTVVSGKTATVTFNNTLKRGDLTVTKTAEDGLEEGMKFRLSGTSYSGLKVDEYAIVSSDGKAYFKDVLIGTGYTLEEVDTPDRYVVPDSQKADIEWNKVTNKSFDNPLKRGDLVVIKTAEDGLEEGLKFHLYGTSYSGLPVDEYATVGSDGKAYFTDILIGTGYTLEEVDTPVRYVVPDKQTVAVEWNKVTEKSFDNPLKKWNMTVSKYDSDTDTAQGDASLAGAVYGIYNDGELIDTYTTDINGQFTTKWYICGDEWTLQEISPSEGYLLDETEYHIGAEAKHYTVEYNSISEDTPEDIIKGKIALIKHADDGSTQIETPEVGAEFEVFFKSSGSYANAKATERDYLICDEFGFAETKELPYGVYTVKQVKGWDGKEILSPFDVYIEKDDYTYRYIINNSEFESYVKIIKTDAETGKSIPYAGAAFQIYNPSGELVSMTYTYPEITTIDTFYTNSEGYLITPEVLPYGKGYFIVEVQAPYGYLRNSEPVYFDITEDNATAESAVTLVIVARPNMPQKGTITVGKTGEVFSSVVESGDIYKPIYEVKGLAGAVYEIRAAEDIYTPDGTLRYTKGTVVDTVITTASGYAVSKTLYLGNYEVEEIEAPYGMILNSEIHTVELTYAGQDVEITETSTDFYNDRQRVQIDLNKVMEQNDSFGIGNNGEILTVQFGLLVAENLIASDGTIIPKDGLIEIVNCDENGYAVFTTDLPVGAKLYVKEIATDSHYILSDAEYPVEFEYAGQDVALVSITINDGNEIDNDIIYGTIRGLKIDRETEETIAGAVFGLFRGDEAEYNEDTAILTAITGEDGVFFFENVPFGNWIIVELEPAEGFLTNNDIHHVHVTSDGEIIEITVVNDRIPEIGTTATVDDEKQTHPYETITIDDEVEYKHLIPGREYTVKGVLMNKTTGKPFLVNGAEVRSEVTFVPETPSGKVTVYFTFDGSGITENTDIVVFESLYKDGIELTVHADIEDDDQTVTVLVPEIGTTATVDGEKEINATEVFTLNDVVTFENLIPGKEYTLKGVLMDKSTGDVLLLEGEEIRSEVTFVPETSSGEVVVSFTFDSKLIKADTEIVVFESLITDGVELTAHADIEDEGQTVTVHVPEIGTQATANGSKEVKAEGKITIEDIVSYKNLTPGKEYTLKGVLMNKTTGNPFLVNGEEIRAEVAFVPETSDGEIAVTFTFDAKGIIISTEIVVFETLYRDGVEIAVHADIEDEDQTVRITPPNPDIPQTGDNSNLGFWIGLGAVALGGLVATIIIGVKRKKEDDED